MNALGGNDYYQAWRALGSQFGQRYPKPQLILCISAHWLTHGWQLTAMAQPRTIHDFGGFPGELYEQQYPASQALQWQRKKLAWRCLSHHWVWTSTNGV